MVVILQSFAKKHNSTAVPSGSGVSKTGTLRDRCTVQSPVIGFAISVTESPVAFNYAHIAAFNRYYFITDWEWNGGLWWAYMQVDVLSTFKTEIGAQECYILRAASGDYDGDLQDEMYPAQALALGQCGNIDTVLYDISNSENGTYVIGVMGKDAKAGCTVYYAMTPTEMQAFRQNMFNDNYMGVMEITAELKKALVNPAQYIVSANWFPYDNIDGESVSKIGLGWWDVTTTAKVVTSYIIGRTQDFLIYAHSKAEEQVEETGMNYLFSAPYSQYTLTIPPFGEIELDPQIIAKGMETEGGAYSCTVHAVLNTDLMTGDGLLYLYTDDITGVRTNGELLAFRSAKMCAPVQVGQITSNVSGAVQSVATSAFNGASIAKVAGSKLGIAAGVAGAVLSGTENIMPRVRALSLNGGMAVFKHRPIYNVRYNPIVETADEENGRPFYAVSQIDALTGYIKTMNADITINGATKDELMTIRNYMNNGFYYE